MESYRSHKKPSKSHVGVNAVVGLDVETSSIGQSNVVLFSVTETAVLIEPESPNETSN